MHHGPRQPGSSDMTTAWQPVGVSVYSQSGPDAVSSGDQRGPAPVSRRPSRPGRGHPQLPPHVGEPCAPCPLKLSPEGFNPRHEPRVGLEEVVLEIFIGDRMQDRRRAAVLRDHDVLAPGQLGHLESRFLTSFSGTILIGLAVTLSATRRSGPVPAARAQRVGGRPSAGWGWTTPAR